MAKASDGCVFLACDWQDLREAEQVTSFLEQRGLSVWAGPRDAGTADPGQYAAATRNAAGRCSALVLLLSGRTVDLASLGEQCRTAEAAGRPIYPVRVAEQAFVPDFPSLRRAKSWIDAAGGNRDAELARLAADLQSLARPAPAPPVPAPQAPASPSTNWQAPAPAAASEPSSQPYRTPSTWAAAGGQRATQPRWISVVWLIVAVVVMLSAVARLIRAFG